MKTKCATEAPIGRIGLEEAAIDMWAALREQDWFVGVGVDDEGLVLYTTKKRGIPKFRDGWKGFHVKLVKSGRPRPR